MPEDFQLDVGLIANVDELEKQVSDGEYSAEVDVSGGTGGAAGGRGQQGDLQSVIGGGTAGAGGGIIGGMSATLKAILGAVTAAVAFLASLKPIQALIGGIFRQIELLTARIISTISPIMNTVGKLMKKIFQVIRNPKEFFSTLLNNLKTFVAKIANSLISAVNVVPGVNVPTISTGGYQSFGGDGQRFETQGRSTRQDNANTLLKGFGISALSPLAAGGYFLMQGLSDEAKKETESSDNESVLEGWLPW